MNIKKIFKDKDRKEIKKIQPVSDSISKKFNIATIERVYKTKSMQFRLSDGTIFARLGIDINSPIALETHFNKSRTVDEFIQSIDGFLQITGKRLSKSDINNLKKEYEKYSSQRFDKGFTTAQKLIDEMMED